MELPVSHAFEYFEFDPAPALAAHVTSYWGFRVRTADPPAHRLWADGCITLTAVSTPEESRWILVGPRVGPLDVPVTREATYWGARFWPDAGGGVLGIRATELRDLTIVAPPAIEHLLGPASAVAGSGTATTATVLDTILEPLVRRAPPLDRAVRQAVTAIVTTAGKVPIAEIAAGIGVGERQLQRRFRLAVGLTPKQFARVRRVRTTGGSVLAGKQNWAELAASHGFADQSHLIHEFSQLTGLTPVAFEERLRGIEHGNVDP